MAQEATKSRPLIMIVDDIPANITKLGEALSSEYNIQVASSGNRQSNLADV